MESINRKIIVLLVLAGISGCDKEQSGITDSSSTAGSRISEAVLKNEAGYVRFTTDFECRKITLVSNNAADRIAGPVTAGALNEVSLTAESGSVAAGTYCFALLPGTLSKGFKLVFTMADGTQRYKGFVSSWDIQADSVKTIRTVISASSLKKDLSASGSANCYLIRESGDYAFRAVRGNTSTSVGRVQVIEVLWESFGTDTAPAKGDLISSVAFSGEHVEFSTPSTFRNGNAVIAARDTEGTVLWSWHIWCASEGWNEQTYHNGAGIMMDRNLGATSAAPYDAGSLGLFYQWGRKDPFAGSSSVSSSTVAASTNSWSRSPDRMTQETARKNPVIFYYGTYNYMPDGSWASAKTAYDPCPAGWRVPDGGDSGSVWVKALNSTSVSFSGSDYGRDFGGRFGEASTIWYPSAGCLNPYGTYMDTGRYGNYWSVTTSGSNSAYSFDFASYGGVGLYDDHERSWGLSVRCQKI